MKQILIAPLKNKFAVCKLQFASCISLLITSCLLPAVSSAQVIAGGVFHSLAVCNDGTVQAWGGNANGQLGDNDAPTDKLIPVQVLGGASGSTYLTGVMAVVAGFSHSIALKNDNTVWAWGNNGAGQLGDNTTTQRNTPVQVLGGASGSAYLTGIIAVAGGDYHSFAIKNDGTLWAWGNNGSGRLGDNTTTQRNTPVQVLGGASGSIYLTGITAVAGGPGQSIALKNDGTVWTWGYNDYGMLGDNSNGTTRMTPIQVLGGASGSTYLTGIIAIEMRERNSYSVKNDGTVWNWGTDGYGQLGNNGIGDRYTPVQVLGGTSGSTYLTGINAIAAGVRQSYAVKNDGTVWSWGYNGIYGQLGDNTTSDRWDPVQVLKGAAPGDTYITGITAISARGYSPLALKNDGTVWDWGWNGNGQLGDNTTTDRWTPVQASPLCAVFPLPVEWLYFNATPENNTLVRCEWATASEINNDYFGVERSKDGSMFTQIGTVKGAGNSSVTLRYEFADAYPYTGLSYYRLRQVDFNGHYEYSPIRPVYIGTFNIITIYPNPAGEYIHYLAGSETGGIVTVKMMDVLGREVLSRAEMLEAGVTEKKLSTAALSSGSYLLQIINGKMEKTQKQFVVK